MISNSTVRKISLVVLIALFAWSCLIVATLGFMLLSILVIAGKAHLSVTLITASTTALGPSSSTSALTKLTQGNDLVGLQVAMWVFFTGCFACLAWFIRAIVLKLKQKNGGKTSGN